MARIFSATFTPYTYEQYAAPVREATAYHQKIQDQYDTALLEAYKLNSMLDQQNDPESWKLYNDTVKTIYDMANYLNTKGLDANAQTNLMRVRMQSQNIFDINAAINRKQEAIKSFMSSANGQNPRYIGIRPEETSVDSWRGGKTPNLYGVDGKQVSDYVQNAVTTMTSQLIDEYSRGGYRITEVGINPAYRQQILNAISGQLKPDENGYYHFTDNTAQNNYMNRLTQGIQQILQNTGRTFGLDQIQQDENTERATMNQSKFASELFNGVYNGIQYSRKSDEDQYALKAVEHSYRMQEKYQDQLYDFYKDPTKHMFLPNGKPNPYYGATQEEPALATNSYPITYNGSNVEWAQKYVTGYVDNKTGQQVNPILTKEKLDTYNAIKDRETKLEQLGIATRFLNAAKQGKPFNEFQAEIQKSALEQNNQTDYSLHNTKQALQNPQNMAEIRSLYNQLSILYKHQENNMLTKAQHDDFRKKIGRDFPENYTYEDVRNWVNNDPEWQSINTNAYVIASKTADPKHHDLLFDKVRNYLNGKEPEIYITDEVGMKKESIGNRSKKALINKINEKTIKPEDVEFIITPESSYQSNENYMIIQQGQTRYLVPIKGLFSNYLHNDLGYFENSSRNGYTPQTKLHKSWVDGREKNAMDANMATVSAIIRQILDSEIPQETTNAKSEAK